MRQTNIVLFYTDKTGPTIKRPLMRQNNISMKCPSLPEGFKYRLAGGVIGTEAAINEVVWDKQLQTLILCAAGRIFLLHPRI